jgi:LmbE family N-acetylglucosaminyl deacetylase
MNPYKMFVENCESSLKAARALPLGGIAPAPRPKLAADAPKALFFAPHPDDECISGGLALRLLREARMEVLNVAVTQGSRKDRQAERLRELRQACEYIGFGLVTTGAHGLENINMKTRSGDAQNWQRSVQVIAAILQVHRPKVILFPHEHDWNSTHIGVHFLVMDALKSMPPDFACYLAETEFWGQMATPNLMVEMSTEDVADMVAATTFHVGEVQRNPYHLMLPAWMIDNVRRGTELVGGQGGAAPDFTFAALHRLRKWSQGNVQAVQDGGRLISRSENVANLFP